MKMYFRNQDSELCHCAEYFQDEMKDAGITEMEVFVAIPDKSLHHFWCKAISDVCLTEDYPCGNHCEDYEPCNGKSGKCRHKAHCYIQGEKFIIKLTK